MLGLSLFLAVSGLLCLFDCLFVVAVGVAVIV